MSNKEYKILIDETTLKENPNYPPGYKVSIPGRVRYLQNGKDVDMDEFRMLILEGESGLEVEADCIDVTRAHEPKYFYSYKPTYVVCRSCKTRIKHTELIEETLFREDSMNVSNDNVCPNCGLWECCYLDFETPDECIDRIKTLTKIKE